jgi:hypothetical protein
MKLHASLLFGSALMTSVFAQTLPDPVQTYFVPLPEDDLFDYFKLLRPVQLDVVAPVSSVVSIAIAANNTIVYYDHWEDGYEKDVTKADKDTTEVWGDGDISNGAPPGVTTNAEDVLLGGTAIVLENDVAIPRVTTNILFDGRDRIQASLPIAVTRFAFPTEPGSLMAGAVEGKCQHHAGQSRK